MRMHPLALALLATALVAPATAQAAPPWSDPVSTGPTADTIFAPAIGFGGDGSALLTWNTDRTVFGRSDTVVGQRATRAGGGEVAYRGPVRGELPAAPAAYGATRTVLLQERIVSRNENGIPRVRLSARFGRTDGSVGRVRTLDTFTTVDRPVVVANDRGQVVAAWIEFEPEGDFDFDGTYRVRMAERRPGGSFGAPRTLAVQDDEGFDNSIVLRDVEAALGEGGDLVVAWSRVRMVDRRVERTVEARVRRAGRPLGDRQVLGRRTSANDIAAAVAPTGRMAVVWRDASGPSAEGPGAIRAAVRPAGPRSFRDDAVLDSGEPSEAVPEAAPGEVAVDMAADGTATAAWSTAQGGADPPTQVRTATTDSRARFTANQELATRGAVGDVAVRPDGATLVTWVGGPALRDTEGRDVISAYRAPGGDFAAPETVSTLGEPAFDPAAAFDPRSGRPTIVWAGRPGGKPSFEGVERTARLRVATRSG